MGHITSAINQYALLSPPLCHYCIEKPYGGDEAGDVKNSDESFCLCEIEFYASEAGDVQGSSDSSFLSCRAINTVQHLKYFQSTVL